jgi:hypothetical protein
LSDYELVLQDLCELFKEIFGISGERIMNNLDTPVCNVIHNLNAHDFLCFLLEISRKFRVVLPNDMMENCMKWNLSEFARAILKSERCTQSPNSITQRS